MRLTIITQTTNTGINHLQMMEVINLVGSKFSEVRRFVNPSEVTEEKILDSDKIIMIVPEWNGSFPWTFKKMIDDSGWPSYFKGKSILLIGTSNTTFGNIMGVTHLQYILEFVGAKVYHQKIAVNNITEKFANNNIVVNKKMNEWVKEFCLNC